MTISYVAVGSTADHATTVTPSLPGGFTAGQLAVLQVVSGHPDDSIPSTPSGWTRAGSFSGGGGAFAAGAGPRRLTFFVRELVDGDTAPTTSIPTGTGSVIGAFVYTLSRSAGTGWRWAATFGEDTSSGTGFSAVCQSAITFAVGDFIVLGWGLANSSAGPGSPGVTATGITFDAVTTHANAAITSGNGARNAWRHTTVTAGSGTQAPTVTATLTAASVGVGAVLRVREASATLTATAQSVFPPRNLVSATGLLAEDIVSATLYRQVGTAREALRAASDVDVSGSDVLLRVDGEQPFSVAVSYVAVLTDANGSQWEVASGSLTSTVTSDVISDAITGIGAAVRLQAASPRRRDRDATRFNVGGRRVMVSKPRSTPSLSLVLKTETDADADDLDAVLDAATEGVVLIRHHTPLGRLDGHYAIPADEDAPTWYDEQVVWTLEADKSEPWPDVLEAAGFTLQDIADNVTSLQDLATAFPGTLLDIALYDWG